MANNPTSILELVSLRGFSEWNRFLALRVLAVLVGIVIPLLVIGRGAAAIIVPIIGGLTLVLFRWTKIGQLLSRWKRDPLALAVLAMLALWLVSVGMSIKPGFSLSIWAQAAGLLLLTAILPSLLAEAPQSHALVLKVLVAGAFLAIGIGVVSIYAWPPLLSYVRPVETTLSYQAALRLKSYAAVMPCLTPVLLWAGIRLRGIWLSFAIGSAAMGLLLVVGTQNRAALGGYVGAIGILLLALALRRMRGRYKVVALSVLLTLVALASAWVAAGLPLMPFDSSATPGLPTWLVDVHRQVIWGFVWDRALERPWFGWGPSTANFLPGADDKIPVIGQTFVPLHAHNWILQLLSDVGFVGLAAAVAALGLLLNRLVANISVYGAPCWAALALCGAFFVSTLANFSIWQSWWQSVFVILLSIIHYGIKRQPSPA